MKIEPHIEIEQPGQPIILYEGKLEVHVEKKSDFIDNSRIVFVFLPKPRLEFYLTGDSTFFIQNIFNPSSEFKIKHPDHNVLIDVIIVRKKISFGQQPTNPQIIGLQKKEIQWSSSTKLSHVKFYLANFCSMLPTIELKSDKWKINIREHRKIKDAKDYLRYSHNYAITHIGKIENIQSNSFDLEAINDVVDSIYYFLSFCRGFWISPILIYGFNQEHNKVWESLEHNVNRWSSTRSWLPLIGSNSIENAFTGFCNKWQNNKWKEIIKRSIKWYVEVSKQSGGKEASIILTQAALEMLANIVLVENRNIVSSSGFEKLEAKDKISLLLNQCSIPLQVPSTLETLSKYAKEYNYSGTQTITELRNRLIHPKLKNRERLSTVPLLVVDEIYLLGKWYLELILLNLFDYRGNYINWTKPQPHFYSDGEPVPWNNE